MNVTQEELKEYEEDMNDNYRQWKEAEKEIEQAIEWRNKKALWYAESAVKYYNAKNT